MNMKLLNSSEHKIILYHTIILLVICSVFSSYTNQGKILFIRNDWDKFNLKGDVMFIEQKNYDIIKNTETGKLEFYESSFGNKDFEFNRKGFLEKEAFYFNGQTINTNYFYSGNGRIESIRKAGVTRRYSYNDKKNQIKIEFVGMYDTYESNAGEISSYILETYDEDGNLSKSEHYKGENNLKKKIVNLYNNKNKLSLEISYDYSTDQVSIDSIRYEYDQNGNLSKIIGKDKEVKTEFFYDNNGNLIEEWEYKIFGKYRLMTTIEDKDFYVDPNTSLLMSADHIPDNLKKYKKDLPLKFTYKYTFDEKNNWKEKIRFLEGEPDLITTRKIKYY